MILSTVDLSGVTIKPSIIEDIDFLVGTDSTQFPLADKLRLINAYYYDTVSDIIGYDGSWEWDDTNKTDFPIGTATLVNNQLDYSLPSGFLKLLRVEVLDSDGNYRKLEKFDEQEIPIALSEFLETGGTPMFYREIGNSIELYPKPATGYVTMAAGLKIYYQRTMTEFTISDEAVSPGFAPQFHRILSIGPSYDYAAIRGMERTNYLKTKLDEMRLALRDYYNNRNKEAAIIIKTVKINSR